MRVNSFALKHDTTAPVPAGLSGGLDYEVNPKRVARLMRLMGIEAIYPKPKLSQPSAGHQVYPYLLKGVVITRPDQVRSTDITYIPIVGGFVYLVAIMDWYSRYVLSWKISNSLDVSFCVEALEEALSLAKPEIFNSDQGSQFTSQQFTSRLLAAEVQISMDGRGRVFDNIFIERLWRTIKYEEIYVKDYQTVMMLIEGLEEYFEFYNSERLHQSLDYRTPKAVYLGQRAERRGEAMGKINRSQMRGRVYRIREYPDEEEKAAASGCGPSVYSPATALRSLRERSPILRAGGRKSNTGWAA